MVCMVKSRDLCLLFQKRASFPNLFIVLNYICTNLEFSLWVCCLCFFSVQFLSIIELVSHCFNCCSIIISFEMCSPLIILFFFFSIYMAIFVHIIFPDVFYNQLLNFYETNKKIPQSALEFLSNVSRMDIFTIQSFAFVLYPGMILNSVLSSVGVYSS